MKEQAGPSRSTIDTMTKINDVIDFYVTTFSLIRHLDVLSQLHKFQLAFYFVFALYDKNTFITAEYETNIILFEKIITS